MAKNQHTVTYASTRGSRVETRVSAADERSARQQVADKAPDCERVLGAWKTRKSDRWG